MNPNLLSLLQQQQQQPGAQTPGFLLGGQVPQQAAPAAPAAAPAGPPSLLPNLNPQNAQAMATGANLLASGMPHPAGVAPTMGMSGPGIQQALGGGMGGGMMTPQMLQLLLQRRGLPGSGNGTA